MARFESLKKALRRVRTTLGHNVRELRLSSGMSQAELAEQAGIRRALISDIERGKTNATLDTMVRIARVLRVEAHELLNARPRSETRK